ncbi:MAG: diguanylate cyclase [Methylomonas sp.]|nr:diguanylate cyclase [Methylomonas sp.]
MTTDYRFTDLVDIEAFRNMLKSFYEATGILHGLVDADNNVISAIGWQQACTDFHRVNPCSNERCLESNRYLAEHLGEGAYVGFACRNGLMDYATPIVIEGKQLATLYFGQLFHEAPDMAFFRRQAEECGFDEESYLAAIRKVPVIPKERIEPIMAFYVQIAQMLARSGLDRLREREAEQRLAELNRDLELCIEQRTAELKNKNQRLTAEIDERRRAEEALRESRTQLQAILDSSPVGIGWSNADGKIEYINKRFTEMFGYTLEDIPSIEHWYRLAYPDAAFRQNVVLSWAREASLARQTGAKVPLLEAPIVCKNGKVRHTIIAVTWVGERRLVNFSDIDARWLAEQRDHVRNAALEMIARGIALPQILSAIALSVEAEDKRMICSILLLDRDGRHLRTGAAPSLPDFYNQAVDGIEIGDGVGSCGTAAATMRRVVVEDVQNHPYRANFKELAGQAGLVSCWSEPILSSKGRLLGTFAIYHRQPCLPDAAALEQLVAYAANLASIAIEHSQADEELERQAHSDFLTDLTNRRYFFELAEAEFARALRYRKGLSLLMLDVDHFKSINDNYGHKIGDIALKTLAETMRRTLRQVDVLGRLGGEEFVAMLPETHADEAFEVAERLRLAVAATEMQTDTGLPLRMTVSIGVATLSDATREVETLLKQADDALYAAKNGGRNQVRAAFVRKLGGGESLLVDFVKLSWNSAYESGHALIDAQHRVLFNHVNELLTAILSGFAKDEVLPLIDALMQDVSRHFESEEAVFEEIGFPHADEHAASHRGLMQQANILVQRFSEDSLAIGELFQFLAHDLIAKHMLHEDRVFFSYL